MHRNRGYAIPLLMVVALLGTACATTANGGSSSSSANPGEKAGEKVKLEGYLEFKKGPFLIIDGQRVVTTPGTKFSAKSGDATSPANIPLDYACRVQGVRRADGGVDASKIETKPNTLEGAEAQILVGTTMAESTWVAEGAIVDTDAEGKKHSMGKLISSGPMYDRARRIVDSVMPPYIDKKGVRVYVVENTEWNAMAMANYSIYVFSGIMEDLDDDELALVLGHEIAHATNEHSRRQASKSQTSGILGQIAMVGGSMVKNSTVRGLAQQATQLGYSAFNNSYSRDYEDQADRVGLRYAYEAGYDYTKAPGLWQKFLEKYGESDKVTNFFYGNHSLASARAKNLEMEIANNYSNKSLDPPLKATRTAAKTSAKTSAGSTKEPTTSKSASPPPAKTLSK